jgi:dTDP-4-dehydrorhamnose reductase
MKMMVTGAGGMTGAAVTRLARARGWECAAFTRADLDITDGPTVASLTAAEKPDVIVNAAAYTAVDAAEDDAAQAMSVNAAGAGNVAAAAERHGAAVIHLSTDYVFDGSSSIPYKPADATCPINVYGESKLAGEIAVQSECRRHFIVRTSWVYSHEGKNFVRTMLRLADEGKTLRVVDDQHGRPTSSADLAEAVLAVAERAFGSPQLGGIFHFANSGITTWYQFAQEIFSLRGGNSQAVTPVGSDEFPTRARRPSWSVLDTSTFEQEFGMTPRPWQQALADTMALLQ